MRGIIELVGTVVVGYYIIVYIAMGGVDIPMAMSLALGMGSGAHENVEEMRPNLQQKSGNRTYPW